MDISRNKITGEIKQAPSLGKHFRLGDWENCLDSNGDIKESHQEALYSLKLKEVIELKKAEINKQREMIRNSLTDFTKDEKEYFFDRGILSRQSMAMAAITLGGNDTIDWVTDDNSIVSLTNEEILSICSHITSTDEREYKFARLRKNEIIALGEVKEGDSVEERLTEVENYDITKVFTD